MTSTYETPFTPILRQTLRAVPDAIGVVFADWDGEAIDRISAPRRPRPPEDGEAGDGTPLEAVDLRLFGAHWGIVLQLVRAALRTFHYGDPQSMILQHDALDVVIHAVTRDYYVLLALRPGGHLARALAALERGAEALRAEM
jgi:hypothetical protein